MRATLKATQCRNKKRENRRPVHTKSKQREWKRRKGTEDEQTGTEKGRRKERREQPCACILLGEEVNGQNQKEKARKKKGENGTEKAIEK